MKFTEIRELIRLIGVGTFFSPEGIKIQIYNTLRQLNIEQSGKIFAIVFPPDDERVVGYYGHDSIVDYCNGKAKSIYDKAKPGLVNLLRGFLKSDLVPVSEREIYREMHYCNGLEGKEFKFEQPIAKEEFLKFLVANGYSLDRLTDPAWYEDHAEIKSNNKWSKYGDKSDTWAYCWVRAYTD